MEKGNILVVDDDKQVLSCFKRMLKEEGYSVTAAESGNEAIDRLREKKYDIVLTDIVMNGVNGIQVLDEVKKISPNTEVILMTGYGSFESAVEGLQKNASDYITKPCAESDLLQRIKKTLDKQKLRLKTEQANTYKTVSKTVGNLTRELNSPLNSIIGNIENALTEIPADNPIYKELLSIKTAAEEISETVHKINELKNTVKEQFDKDYKSGTIYNNYQPKELKNRNILIVDDEKDIALLYSRFLQREGYYVDTAFNGLEAVYKVKEKFYDIIILDICMPEMDGCETFEEINKYYNKKDSRTPVAIMITGYDVNNVSEKFMDKGVFKLLHKPVKLKTLIKTIEMAENSINNPE